MVVARTGGEALRLFPKLSPDVVVLDIGLPDSDGRDVCLALRAGGLAAPVLFLTARDRVHDKVAGFEPGGDDYLTKPFELPELLVRIAALARRAGATTPPPRGCTSTRPGTPSPRTARPSRSPRPSSGCSPSCWPPPSTSYDGTRWSPRAGRWGPPCTTTRWTPTWPGCAASSPP